MLCGIIAGLLAQGMKPLKAAALAVFIHGMAADSYAGKKTGIQWWPQIL